MGTVIESDGFVMESSNSDEAAVKASIAPAEAAPTEPPATVSAAEEPEGESAKDRDEKGRFKARETAEDGSGKDERPLGKPRHDPRARVQQATAQAAEARRERDAARAELVAAQRELESLREARAGRSDKEPVETDFADYTDFVKARARYDARQEFDAQRIEQAESRHNQALSAERTRRIESFKQKLADAGGKEFIDRLDSDLVQLRPVSVLSPDEKPTQANAVAELILLSEIAPALMEYFTKEKAELQRLTTLPMSQLELTRAIARIETKLEGAVSAGSAPKVEISQAKPPIKPVTGSPQSVGELSEDAPFEEWFEKQNQKDRAARR